MTLACAEPNCATAVASGAPRCAKGHVVRGCGRCDASNRAFANFCRACSAPLPPSRSSWSGFKGGSRRLGFNASRGPASWTMQKFPLTLRLGDTCRSLLAFDSHLIAISVTGTIEIVDPVRGRSICRFHTQGPVTSEPCISNGVLYVSTRNQLTAFALAPLTLESPRVQPLWQLAMNGTPIHALTPAGDRLYVTLAAGDTREVYSIEQSGRPPRPKTRLLHRAARMTWLAADPSSDHVSFFSEDDGRVLLHAGRDEVTSRPVMLLSVAEQPIALLSDAIFGVFDASRQLYRINAQTGAVEEPLDSDTQAFALTHDVRGEWDRDVVRIDSEGVHFVRSSIRDSFAPLERAVKASPLVVNGAAAVVGMEDGRVLLYELAHLPHHEVWRLDGNSSSPITAFASFDSCIAAGNRDGVVEICELREKGTAH